MNIVPNHVYSKYSLLYSINRIDHLVKKAKALGYESLALSDLHVMYGIVPFYKTCIAHGIKPIIGLEVSVQYEEERVGRVRLFAKNNEGYTNLLQLSTLLLHKKAQEVFITKAELLAYQSNVQIVIPYENGPLYL